MSKKALFAMRDEMKESIRVMEDRLDRKIDMKVGQLREELKEHVTNTQSEFRTVKADIASIKGETKVMKSDIKELKADVREIKKGMTELHSKVDMALAEMREMNAKLTVKFELQECRNRTVIDQLNIIQHKYVEMQNTLNRHGIS